jgi:hypothetical protein
MAKKKTTTKSTTKKSVKKSAPKKPSVGSSLKIKNKAKHIADLELKMENIALKAADKRKGNKNDKIVADLLDEKVAKYWGKQKQDIEAADEE